MNSTISKFSGFPMMGALALATCAALSALTAHAQTQDFWQGGTADFNVASNWTLNIVPGSGYAANNDSGSNNVVLIQAGDPVWTFNGFRDGVSASGAFVQNGSTVNLGVTENGWLRMGINAGSIGYYTINSNAILNTPDGITVGENGSGVLNIYGGTVNIGTAGDGFYINNVGNGASGIVNQTNGTVVCTNQVWISVGPGTSSAFTGTGAYNLSGGTLNVNNYIVVGRAGGNGTLSVTGGTINMQNSGDYISVGTPAGTTGNSTALVQQSGGTINCAGQFLIPVTAPVVSGTYNLSGTGVLNETNWLAVGRDGGTGYMNMTGGVITMWAGNGGNLDIGASGQGTLTQSGGIITNTALGTWIGEQSSGNGTWTMTGGTNYLGQVTIGVDSGATGILNLDGGLFNTFGIGTGGSSAYSSLNLNGGILQANASNPNFVTGLTFAEVSPGGAIIDSQGYNVTIAQTLYDNGDGPLTKLGTGTLIMSGANTYAGATAVNAGMLVVGTSSSGSGGYSVADHASLGVTVQSANGQLSMASLTTGSSSGAVLNLNLGAYGNPSAAPVAVVGAWTVGGTVTINIADSVPSVGVVPLIQYGSLGGSGSVVLGTLPSGVVATLMTNGSTIVLNVTSGGAPRWEGYVNDLWDIGMTTNWYDIGAQEPVVYHNGNPVLFDDNAVGTTTVDLVANVTPGGITFNNDVLPYTLFGTGMMGGSTGLLLEGTDTVSIFNTNTFTGPVDIFGGTLIVSNLANGGLPSAIGASSASPTNLIISNAILSYVGAPGVANRGFTIADTNSVIDAEGNLTLGGMFTAQPGSAFIKTGPGVLALTGAGNNQFSGGFDPGVQVVNGTMLLDGSAGNQTNHTQQELWVGCTPNSAASLIVSNTTLNVDSWLGLGRGNGTSNFISTMTVDNSSVSFGNVSLGYANGIAGNLAQQFLTLNGASTFLDTGVVNLAESGGSTGTITINGTSVFTGGNQPFYVGLGGGTSGNLIIANSGKVIWQLNGNSYWFDIGNNGGVGSLLIENNGILMTEGDFNITDQGTSTGTVVVQDNGQLYANNLFVTKVAGATGNFTITNNATVYSSNGLTIAANTTANGTVTLAGGSLAVNLVQGNSSSTPNGIFNMNGGTIIAHGPYFGNFMYYLSAANVLAGGVNMNLGGLTIQITQPLLNGGGGGGLTLIGTGTLYLNSASTYTGTTLVNAGTALGGTGSVASPVVVASGGTLNGDTGTIGTFTINNTLTLSPGSTTAMSITPSANDEIEGLTSVSYGGTLVVTNTSTNALTVGHVYQLFNSAVAGSNNFSSVKLLPTGTATFDPATGTLTIASTSSVTVLPPVLSGGNLILTGTGGAPGSGYTLLTTTNLATPLSAWVTNTTGTLNGSGSFSNSIPVNTNEAAQFFVLRQP